MNLALFPSYTYLMLLLANEKTTIRTLWHWWQWQWRWLLISLLWLMMILTIMAMRTKDDHVWESLRRFKNLHQNKVKWINAIWKKRFVFLREDLSRLLSSKLNESRGARYNIVLLSGKQSHLFCLYLLISYKREKCPPFLQSFGRNVQVELNEIVIFVREEGSNVSNFIWLT